MSSLPTFLLAGSGKSGSTSLWHYLKEHPEICMAEQKEPLFFSRVTGQMDGGKLVPTRSGRYDKGIEWYKSLFDHCSNATALGEATAYLYLEDAPELINKHIPNVKFVFLMRDPVDRAYSHYWQAVKGGRKLPDTFEELVRQDHPYFQAFRHVSSYAQHLKRYYEVFEEEQIKIIFLQDLKEKPRELLREVQAFVGVDPDFVPESLGKRFNKSAVARSAKFQRLIRRMRHTSLKQFMPNWLRKSLSFLARRISALNKKEIDYGPMDTEIRKSLIDGFMEDIEYLEEKTGRDLTEWKTV
ncbi:MAG: sulfotransferase domain-containing protein [bacterium]